ncbi:MAG: glycoside hydrolase family 5 protein [Candidatus Omnitrophica bacterium]|nr:glycoside hydrolase family 5 protein [Candidatus Omnitrophota bacterium]
MVALTLGLPVPSSFAGDVPWLLVAGSRIVDETGREVRLRGVQMDFGSARGDIPRTVVAQDGGFLDEMIDHVVTEEDFKDVARMGANSARFSLTTCKDFENEEQPFVYREENLKRLDKAVAWAEKYGIYLVLSMRQSPGGHNPSPHSGNEGSNALWSSEQDQQRLVSLWKTIAQRYADRPVVAGYDLLNEPFAPDQEIYNSVFTNIIDAIRSVDKRHMIFWEGNEWGKKLDWIKPPPLDGNIVFSIHFYEPGSYAVKGQGDYPSRIQGRDFDKEALRKALERRTEYARKLNKPVYVGEFGAMAQAGNYLQYDRDILEILEGLKLHWGYWHYKNIKGNTQTQAIYHAQPENPFFQLMKGSGKGKVLSMLPAAERDKALGSLETSGFHEKTQLKQLLVGFLSANTP